jgi:hypothetical protein
VIAMLTPKDIKPQPGLCVMDDCCEGNNIVLSLAERLVRDRMKAERAALAALVEYVTVRDDFEKRTDEIDRALQKRFDLAEDALCKAARLYLRVSTGRSAAGHVLGPRAS